MTTKTATKKPQTTTPKSRDPRAILTREQVKQIAASTLHDERTIKRWAEGGPVEWNTAARIERACSAVGAEVLA